MPVFDNLTLVDPKTFVNVDGSSILAYQPNVVLKTSTVNLSGVTTVGNNDFTVVTVPSDLQPFSSWWAVFIIDVTAMGSATLLTPTMGTNSAGGWDDMVVGTAIGGTTNIMFGSVDSQQGSLHYSAGGPTNKMAFLGVTASTTSWASATVKIRIVRVGAGGTPPSGTAYGYIFGCALP